MLRCPRSILPRFCSMCRCRRTRIADALDRQRVSARDAFPPDPLPYSSGGLLGYGSQHVNVSGWVALKGAPHPLRLVVTAVIPDCCHSASASLEAVARGRRARRRAASDHRKRNDGRKKWPLALRVATRFSQCADRAPERERQSSLPSYHAARRALRGLEKNTTPSDPQWCGSFTEWPLGEWPPSGHSV